jgi:hypothetical protein
MTECPLCKRRTFTGNLRYHVKELDCDGNMLIHEFVCITCWSEISSNNAIYSVMNAYFSNHREQLLRLRQEFAVNNGGKVHD